MAKSDLKVWIMALRPKTLSASFAPVLIGTAMAFGDGIAHMPTAFLCLCAALSIQIGTNLANDYYDYVNGADTKDRIGPTRATQAGLIEPAAMRLAFIAVFVLAAVFSFWLIKRGGWPVAVIGITAILSGIFYTTGPKPLGYMGLGDLFVLIFFGPVAVAGTYYVQSFEINMAVVLAGLSPGLISVAILTVNNLRDIESDRKTGKNTLAVRFGRPFAVSEYLYALVMAALIPVLIYWLIEDHIYIMTSSCVLLLAVPVIRTVSQSDKGPALNEALARTGRLLMIFGILFSIGWVL